MIRQRDIMSFCVFISSMFILLSCGRKTQKQSERPNGKQATEAAHQDSDNKNNDNEHAKEISELRTHFMLSENVGNAFEEICETDYKEKEDESDFQKNEFEELTSGPITVKIPAKNFAVLVGTEYPTACIRLGNNGMRHAYVTLVTTSRIDNGWDDTRKYDRMNHLALELTNMRNLSSVTGLSAEVQEIGKHKWMCLSCRRKMGSGDAEEVIETKRYISFLANREVEVRFSYMVTSEGHEGRKKTPFTDKLMHKIVSSVATIPVDQYKKPNGLADLNAAVNIDNIQENIDLGIEGANMTSIGKDREAKIQFENLASDYLTRTIQIGQGTEPKPSENKSSFSGETAQILAPGIDSMVTLIPMQYYTGINMDGGAFTELVKTYKNKSDCNPESYISVGTRYLGKIADQDILRYLKEVLDDIELYGYKLGIGYREEMQAGIQVYGDKLFFVTIELSNATQPYGKSLTKRAFLYQYPYMRIVTFTDYGEELKPLTQGEIEVLKSMSYTPSEKDKS